MNISVLSERSDGFELNEANQKSETVFLRNIARLPKKTFKIVYILENVTRKVNEKVCGKIRSSGVADLFKSREARVYMFTPLSSSTLQILKLCCAQSLEFTDIKEQECRHDRPQLCSIIWRAQNSPPSFVSATFSQTFIAFLLFSGGYSFHLYYVGNWFMIKFTFCIIKPRRLDGDFASLMSPHIRNFSGVLSLILHWSSDFNNWTATIMHVLVFGSSRELFIALQGLSLSLNLCTSGFGLSFPCLTLNSFLLFPEWHCQLSTVFYW